jgi:ectoine hydroxylase-related dioxygenase (phytanoyl-CoA dioxygenase family)
MDYILTPEQREQMEAVGYCVLPNVFTREEMEALSVHIEAFQERHEAEIRAKGGTEGISRAGEISFTAFLAEQNAQIRAFVQRPEFVSISTQLLGPDVDLYWNQSVYKQPEGTREFPWHQDDGYTPVTPSPYLTLWLAVSDATPENGCVSVLPGSYKRGLLPHYRTPIGLVCYENDAPDQGVRVPLEAGSIAAFWSLTCHKSGPNLSPGIRKAYVIQYSCAGLRNAVTGEAIVNRIPIARDGSGVKG